LQHPVRVAVAVAVVAVAVAVVAVAVAVVAVAVAVVAVAVAVAVVAVAVAGRSSPSLVGRQGVPAPASPCCVWRRRRS
jgi:hypothetical protein